MAGDGKAFAYSAMRTVNRFNLYSDVYLHKVKGPPQCSHAVNGLETSFPGWFVAVGGHQ